MCALVPGHKGYIGTIMVPMLQTEGFDVIGRDNDHFDGCIFIDQSIYGGIPDIPYVRKDIHYARVHKTKEIRPNYVLILPWNIKEEVMDQMSNIGKWNGQFIVSIPEVRVYDASGTEVRNAI